MAKSKPRSEPVVRELPNVVLLSTMEPEELLPLLRQYQAQQNFLAASTVCAALSEWSRRRGLELILESHGVRF